MNLVERVCGHTWMILRHKYWVFRLMGGLTSQILTRQAARCIFTEG